MNNSGKTPNSRLFIGGLPYRFTEGELLELFAPFGRVTSLKIMHTPWGKSRGIGFVEFDNLDSAIEAKTRLHNREVAPMRTIIVDYSEPDPMKTEEGRRRHEDALHKNPRKFQNSTQSSDSGERRHFSHADTPRKPFKSKPKFGSTRQSVYDARTHHSKVGSKFAKRKRK